MKKLTTGLFALLLAVSALAGCKTSLADPTATTQPGTSAPATEAATQATTLPEPTETEPEDPIDTILQQMTLREKVGQLFIVRPDALTDAGVGGPEDGVLFWSSQMANNLSQYPAGGIAIFGENISDPFQLTRLIGALQSASKLPLFMSVDEECGIVVRLANRVSFDLPRYPSAASVGKNNDPADALECGITIGAYLQELGFNMDFAPVADVNTNPFNPVIGKRAFSSDATVAAQMAKAMAEGLKQKNIIPVFKHFPGHGDTAEDSHKGIAVNNKDLEEMAACEWLPYASLTDDDCVMVGHIATPSITGDLTPATMSATVIGDILRNKLHFGGVIITDSMSMGAIINEYDAGEAAVKVIAAGCDIILCPEDYRLAFDGILAALEDGSLSEQRINESVYRILLLKEKYGLLAS